MNFNVHRRNNSLAVQPDNKQKREGRSLKKVRHLAPQDSSFLQAKDIYNSQGDLRQAVKLFHQFLTTNPKHNQALYLCAVSQLKLGQSEGALQHLMPISDQYHNKPNAMLLAAMALNKLGRVGESLEIVNDCIRRYDGFEEAICFRGKLYLTLKYYHRAQQDFKRLASQPNSSFLPFHSLGDCYKSQGKPQKALAPYLKGLQLLGQQEGTQSLRNQMQLKVGICLYQLQRFEQSLHHLQQVGRGDTQKGCEFYFYMGICEIKSGRREQGLLHLQYCLRVQGNISLMKKAYKKLIQLYLENYLFYEALNVVKLGDICKIRPEGWANVIQAFMFIIKGHYQSGVLILTNVTNQLKKIDGQKKVPPAKRQSSHLKNRYNQTSELRKGAVLGSPAVKAKEILKDKKQKTRYFSTKSVARVAPKIESTRVRTKITYSSKKDQIRVKTEYVERDQSPELYNGHQKQLIYPLILLFKAYGQFFQGNFFACYDTYQEYETYIKDVFGRQSDVVFNKYLCEGLLMSQNGLHDEALMKYGICVDINYQKHAVIPLEPLLYKVVLLAKLALQTQINQEQDQATPKEILQSTLDLFDNYNIIFETSSLALYFRGLICLALKKTQESRALLDQALKAAQDCSWKWLWVKGVVQNKLGNYYDAIKEFSAGLILQNRPQLYLGRSIAFLLLSERKLKKELKSSRKLMKSVHLKQYLQQQTKEKQGLMDSKTKNDLLVQNCFEDLQKYIQLQTNQEDISYWVSKILFCNGAYDEAIRSLNKISTKTNEITVMNESVAIYQGQFSQGGTAGLVIQAAFEGKYLSMDEQSSLLQKRCHKSELGCFWDEDYEKWLIILHLYVRQSYALLLKYLQRQLFECQEGTTQVLLRYNVAIVYLVLGEDSKAANTLKSLTANNDRYNLGELLEKIRTLNFDQDECLQDLREEVGINCSKLLSNYLPYRPVALKNNQHLLRIYARPSIPFPNFPRPSLRIEITNQFIMEEINSSAIEKRIDAPWIRRTDKKTVQFTQKLEQSALYMDMETAALKTQSKNNSFFLQ